MLEAPKTKAAKKVDFDKKSVGELLVSNLPYISAIDENTIMLRDGALMGSFAVEGVNADTIDSRFTAELSTAFGRFIAHQKGNVAFYVHRMSLETKPTIKPVEGHPFNVELDRRWLDYLQNIGLRERLTMVTIILPPPQKISKLLHFFDKTDSFNREEIAARALRLDQMIKTCMATTSAAKPRRLRISDGEWLSLLRTMVDGTSAKLVPGTKFVPLSDLLVNANIHFVGNKFIVHGPCSNKKRYGTIISIKDYPSETFPGIFDRLNLPYDMVISQSFTPIDNVTAQGKISRVRKQMTAAEDAAVSLLHQLEEAADDVASGRVVIGMHHCSIELFCDSEKELEEAMTYVTRAMQDAGSAIVRESFSARSVYFAQHPGNFTYRTRPAMISSQNFAELCALH
ncbi:MAG: type IV secretion protein, partial [Pseudomonadota bacterium]